MCYIWSWPFKIEPKTFVYFQENPADIKDIDCEFLPLVYDILKRVEKDPTDASTKNKAIKMVDVELHPHGTAPIFSHVLNLFVCIKLKFFLTIFLSLSDLFP